MQIKWGEITMNMESIPELMVKNRFNISKVSRIVGVSRDTVRAHQSDVMCENHVIINGTFMSSFKRKGD